MNQLMQMLPDLVLEMVLHRNRLIWHLMLLSQQEAEEEDEFVNY